MATTPVQQVINNGAFVDDPSAETVYQAFEKSKINFNNLWFMVKNQGYDKIFLSLVGIDTTQDELVYISEAIRRGKLVNGSYGGAWSIEPYGRKPLFYTATPLGDSGGVGASNTFEYRYYRVHKAGQKYGGTGVSVNPVYSNDISPAGMFSVDASNTTNYINLGNIGTANVWTKFNEGKPAPNLGDPWNISGMTLVSAIQNGVDRVWGFIGNQRLGIDSGDWGGSDITNPEYLAAIEADFNLFTNQPELTSYLFITKASKEFRGRIITDPTPILLPLSTVATTYELENNTGNAGEVSGFSSIATPPTYAGMDIYIKNKGDDIIILKHDVGSIPFYFKTESDLTLRKGDIVQLKYNKSDNQIELVGVSEVSNLPVPFGNLRILKIEQNSNNNILEIGDRVVSSNLNDDIFLNMGVYVGGDEMELSSYESVSIDYYDPNNP